MTYMITFYFGSILFCGVTNWENVQPLVNQLISDCRMSLVTWPDPGLCVVVSVYTEDGTFSSVKLSRR